MKKIPINTTPGGLAYGIKASYFKNASLTTLTGGGASLPLLRGAGGFRGRFSMPARTGLARRYSPGSEGFLGRTTSGGLNTAGGTVR